MNNEEIIIVDTEGFIQTQIYTNGKLVSVRTTHKPPYDKIKIKTIAQSEPTQNENA